MRHAVAGYKLNRTPEHRRAMFRNLSAALFQHAQITTTLPKARAVQPFVEKLITLARRGDLHARRRVQKLLGDRYLVDTVEGEDDASDVERDRHGQVREAPRLMHKLFSEIGPRYQDRPGGYTRIVRLGSNRIGDGTDLVVLQLVGEEEGPNVRGRYSRRRRKQNNRAAFHARLRRRGREGEAPEQAPPSPEPESEHVSAEAAVEQPAAEAQAPPESEGAEQQQEKQ